MMKKRQKADILADSSVFSHDFGSLAIALLALWYHNVP
jgi:hypothetical protein